MTAAHLFLSWLFSVPGVFPVLKCYLQELLPLKARAISFHTSDLWYNGLFWGIGTDTHKKLCTARRFVRKWESAVKLYENLS